MVPNKITDVLNKKFTVPNKKVNAFPTNGTIKIILHNITHLSTFFEAISTDKLFSFNKPEFKSGFKTFYALHSV